MRWGKDDLGGMHQQPKNKQTMTTNDKTGSEAAAATAGRDVEKCEGVRHEEKVVAKIE